MTERQKRKAARGSSQSSNTPSLMSDVTKRASLLWTSRKAKNTPPSGIGTHTVLQSSENVDTVPLNQLSPAHSPTRSSSLDSTATSAYAQNPFEHPEDSSRSISTSHTDDTITLAGQSSAAGVTSLHTQTRSHPPPQPLNLPPPRTPPPTVPLVSSPPPEGADPNKPEPEVRWWHDWLCGCGEGKDRGGDHQVLLRDFSSENSISNKVYSGWEDQPFRIIGQYIPLYLDSLLASPVA